ncbi:MAG: hypothetical protein J3K34DRAFT_398297 [Monoraphidium minutum]|nr:MAG: hypothetical protein J3K34DRAFT_398297 [Monoraphidium minutum]
MGVGANIFRWRVVRRAPPVGASFDSVGFLLVLMTNSVHAGVASGRSLVTRRPTGERVTSDQGATSGDPCKPCAIVHTREPRAVSTAGGAAPGLPAVAAAAAEPACAPGAAGGRRSGRPASSQAGAADSRALGHEGRLPPPGQPRSLRWPKRLRRWVADVWKHVS